MLDRYLSSRLSRLCLAATLILASTRESAAVNASSPNIAPTPKAADVTKSPERDARTRLNETKLLSEGLIEKAAKGNSPAHQFRIEARIYRELLRQLMLDNRALPNDEQIPRNLLLEMVRMSALLHAAADCKTGLVIICPPDLMRQLKSQQARIDQQLMLNRLHQE